MFYTLYISFLHLIVCPASRLTPRHIHRRISRQTQTHRHTDTQTHRHTDTQTHRHTDTQTRTDTHRHAQTRTDTHRQTDTQTHRHKLIHRRIRMHAHMRARYTSVPGDVQRTVRVCDALSSENVALVCAFNVEITIRNLLQALFVCKYINVETTVRNVFASSCVFHK